MVENSGGEPRLLKSTIYSFAQGLPKALGFRFVRSSLWFLEAITMDSLQSTDNLRAQILEKKYACTVARYIRNVTSEARMHYV